LFVTGSAGRHPDSDNAADNGTDHPANTDTNRDSLDYS
jgi:hypothetical protein